MAPPMTGPPDIAGAEHRFAEIETADAGRLRVHYAEAGSGPPLMLLHGWPQHFWCWRRVVPLLAADFRLICPDLRGFGWTDAPGRGYDNETFAADTVALLDALDIERAGVVGHDWGGFTGFVISLRHPDRVDGLLALSTPVPWVRLTPSVAAASWRSWYAWGIAGVGEQALRRRPGFAGLILRHGVPDHVIAEQEAAVYADRLREPARARASQLLYRSYLRLGGEIAGRRPYASMRLTVPARLLLGRGDQAVRPALVSGWQQHADDMAVELLEGCGHFLPEERPELVARRAADLFSRA
jgi:pimeloyl-ACP methyl ester carboxylesterase